MRRAATKKIPVAMNCGARLPSQPNLCMQEEEQDRRDVDHDDRGDIPEKAERITAHLELPEVEGQLN